MSTSYSVLLPFDGSCRGSVDADITLTFASGEPLETHAGMLRMASPILKNTIEKEGLRDTLHLGSDDRQSWLLLLHFLHPQGAAHMFQYIPSFDVAELDAMLAIANKYAMDFAVNSLDCILEYYIRQKALGLYPLGWMGGRSAMFRPVLQDKSIMYLMSWCVNKGLHASAQSCKEYIQRCLTFCFRVFSPDATPRVGYGGHELADLIRQFSEMGHKDLAIQFAQEILGCLVFDA